MTSLVGPHERAVDGDLDRIANQTDAGEHAAVSVAHTVAGPGEAQRPKLGIHTSEDLVASGRPRRLGELGAAIHALVILLPVTPRMRGDDDAVVRDVEQASVDGHGHRLAGKVAPDVVAMLQDRDASLVVDAAGDELLGSLRLR